MVTASRKPTVFLIDPPQPPSGNVPFTVRISGILRDAETLVGIGGKSIRLFANGARIADVGTNPNPLVGWLGIWWFDWRVEQAGTYTIHAEFFGDSEWEGCEETNDIVSAAEGAPPTPPPTLEIGGLALLGLLFIGGLALGRRKPEKG